MRVWLDDRRPMPPGYDRHARTADEAIALLATGEVEAISLDHDLGPAAAGTGYDVAKWIAERLITGEVDLGALRIRLHTDNPRGRFDMRQVLQAALRRRIESEFPTDDAVNTEDQGPC